MKVAAVASLNGFVFAEEYDGLVTVNPDRTSLVTFLIPLPGAGPVPFVFRGVISDNHQQHDIILESVLGAPPASTVTISLRRQNRSNCSNNNLNDGYALTMRGFVNPPPGSPVPPTPRAPRPRRARRERRILGEHLSHRWQRPGGAREVQRIVLGAPIV